MDLNWRIRSMFENLVLCTTRPCVHLALATNTEDILSDDLGNQGIAGDQQLMRLVFHGLQPACFASVVLADVPALFDSLLLSLLRQHPDRQRQRSHDDVFRSKQAGGGEHGRPGASAAGHQRLWRIQDFSRGGGKSNRGRLPQYRGAKMPRRGDIFRKWHRARHIL